ncbi:MAG: helix-turn-helix domain-containing protein [Geodermatophilales bacterium]|nr:helix-turn-helix domain-containing protein [Geodermatophilales bacterium]
MPLLRRHAGLSVADLVPAPTGGGSYADRGGDVQATVTRKKRETPPVPPIVTGEVEARVIALACTEPPEGRDRWSLRLLEKHVALTEELPDLDHSTIGRVLKKRSFALI